MPSRRVTSAPLSRTTRGECGYLAPCLRWIGSMVVTTGYNHQIERQAPSIMPQGCRAVGLKTRSRTPTLLVDEADCQPYSKTSS